ncbi:MAG: Na/Pi cotransporter family protein [Oscillospiraceae bacterium]|nr:Na/Pi cotransporter family protein [Oscillospiraceae bacterium]
MNVLNLIGLLSGLALFLYGISLMGDGLSKVAGDRLQKVLYQLTSNPFKGILLGIGVTALIQSSSATSVMAIGFVNSGLMQFHEAISIILGSIVGTSITGWIVSLSALNQGEGILMVFSTTFITGVLAVIGIFLYKFSKKPMQNHLGSILLGLAVLLFGMNAMSSAVTPLRENPAFIALLTRFSNPLLGILVGIVFTAIIQSSAAAVGILQALSMTGTLSFAETYPIILGIAVGGALPVLLSATGASLNARRTALIHLMIDIFGAVFCGAVFYAVNAAHPFAFMGAAMNPVRIAALNTVFRIVTVLVLTPFIRTLGKLACAIMKEKPEKAADTEPAGDWDLLDERFISHPAIAIEQSRIVVCSMAAHTQANLEVAVELLHDYSEEGFREVQELEDTVDRYEDKIGTYLVRISSSELTQLQNEDLYRFLHAITDLERISDHATNISENAKELHDKEIVLSPDALEELKVMEAAVREVVTLALRALTEQDPESAHMVEPLEELIDNLSDEMKNRHVARLQKGLCTLQHGFVFNDLITNFERISDHCSNIAVAMIELEQDAFDTHNYVDNLIARKDEEFSRYFQKFADMYHLD